MVNLWKIFIELIDNEWNNIEIMFAEPWNIPWKVPKNERDDYELHLLEKGKGTLTVNKDEYELEKGDIVLLHSINGNSFKNEGAPFRFIFFTFRIKRNRENTKSIEKFNSLLKQSDVSLHLKNSSNTQYILYKMHECITIKFQQYQIKLKMLMMELILDLEREAGCSTQENHRPAKESEYMHTRINNVIAFLYENYHKEITLKELGECFNLHPRYLSTLFKRVSGRNIIDVLKQIRLEKAKKLLLYTSLSITDITFETGFGSSQYFCRVFSKSEGVTPSLYRKTRSY